MFREIIVHLLIFVYPMDAPFETLSKERDEMEVFEVPLGWRMDVYE